MTTVSEAARRMNRDPETIRRWIRSGRLPARKVGAHYVINEEDLDAIESPGQLPLPSELQVTLEGNPQPNWVKLLRESRGSH